MDEESIKKMVKDYGFDGIAADMAFRLASEVERETRHIAAKAILDATGEVV